MEGSSPIIDETMFVEVYASTDDIRTATVVVGFMEDKTAYLKQLLNDVPNVEEVEWSAWQPWGNSSDYTDNAAFANLNGCPFKVDNMTVQDASA